MNKKEYEYEVSAAGRVNIIGEHIDYCGGKVLPAALSLKNTVYVRRNNTDKINIKWTTTKEEVSLDIHHLENYRNLKYGNYQAGCALEWLQAGHKLIGCDMLQDCTVPFGSGLSSSAAIEVSTLVALAVITGEKYDPVEIALLAQKVEHNYIGVNCGIMDQYTSACGSENKALLLDCKTLKCEYFPFDLQKYSLVITNCNKPHNLIESKYNERRSETEAALKILQTKLNVSCLAEITIPQFKEYKSLLPDLLQKRAWHVVSECDRVRLAVLALKDGNIELLGQFLNDSHASLKNDFEVTGKEPDALVASAQAHPSCVGSRLTGGGFGGCTISIVESSKVPEFKKFVYEKYLEATGYKAEFYETKISNGIEVQKIVPARRRQKHPSLVTD